MPRISVGTLKKHPSTGVVSVVVNVTNDSGAVYGPIEVPLIKRGVEISPGLFFYDNPPGMPANGVEISDRVRSFIANRRAEVETAFGNPEPAP